ncbi:MAG: hypothetical protein IMW98_07960 [Firmicutes bacterium]|nr:hypothetical protein [Bacillota bacterium]
MSNYEESDAFTEREKVALRYADAITWDPDSADDKMWEDLHRHFTEPELVELGAFIGFIAGGQRWIKTLGVKHGEYLADTAVGLSPKVAQQLKGDEPPEASR